MTDHQHSDEPTTDHRTSGQPADMIESAGSEADQSTEPTRSDRAATNEQRGSDTVDDAAGQDADEGRADSASHEAAKYRRRLREAEAERDTLRNQVATLQRAEAERIAGRTVKNPSALWVSGVALSDLVAADGSVDSTKVAAAARKAADALGLARPSMGNFAPSEGNNPTVRSGRSFTDAFKPER